jgi:hypothetical protein
LPAQLSNNHKLDKIKTILDDLNADIFTFNEHRNNLRHKENRRHGINHLFYGGEALVKGIWGFNKHETDDKFLNKKTLEGGTGLVAFGQLASWMNSAGSGVDPSGLGRWTFMEFRSADGHSTIVLSGYVPCKNNRPNTGTTYQQHRRHLVNKLHCLDCPRERLLADLKQELSKWRDQGKNVIVCLDANEDIYKDII